GFILEGAGGKKLSGGTDLLRSFNYLWELFFPSLLYFACVFPSENRLVRRVPLAGLWIFAPHVFHLGIMLLQTQGAVFDKPIAWMSRNTIGSTIVHVLRVPTELLFGFHVVLFSAVNLLYIAAALTLLWLSYRRATNTRIRAQLRTVCFGLASCAGLYAVAVPIPTLLNHSWPPLTRSTLIVAALVLGSAGIAYSMVRYRFLDAKLIARKSILYALTSAFLVSVYLTVIRQLDALLQSVTGFDVTVFETAILLIALVLFQPVVSWLEEALEKFFLRERSDHRTLLRRMSGEVLTTDPYLVLPLRHAGQFLGLISLGRKITETRYTAEEMSLLETLANQTSVALKNALLYEENLAKSVLEEELAVARRIQQQFLPR